MKRNNISTIIAALFVLVSINSCDEGFDELNRNKVAITSISPAFILNNAIINASPTQAVAIYDIGIVQQIVSPNSGVIAGANFNQDNRALLQPMWPRYYQSVIRHSTDAILQTKGVPDKINLLQMARIVKAYGFMVLTDTFGDIPYFEAGKGFSDGIVAPKYDAQKDIYADIIKELTEAAAALSTSAKTDPADILYAGDVAKWKKLANSLLLRAGMRIMKADATAGKAAVLKAIEGGVMTSNADNFLVKHDANYQNAVGQMLNSTEANNFYMAAPFVNYLKSNNDPRLGAMAVRYKGAASGPEQTEAKATRKPEDQIGMPIGFDNNGATAQAKAAGLASFYDFTQVDRTRITKTSGPAFFCSYAQTLLLLAEAAQTGITTGNAADLYKNGIKAHMEQLSAFDAGATIPAASITAYLDANPLNTAKALEQINTQYWVASFMNGPEAFANFRRSGFPTLSPNTFAGRDTKGPFINRLTYPNSEISNNSANVQAAIARQGADNLDTKVWWHK
jgi:hypothetical protein